MKLSVLVAAGILSAGLSISASATGYFENKSNKADTATMPTETEKSSSVKGMASDTWITTQVKTKLLKDGWTGVSVETNNGVVLLTGEVKSDNDKATIDNVAKTIQDVKRVDNQLIVK